MDSRVVTAHIPTELVERIDKLAARLDRPTGGLSNRLAREDR